MARRPAPSPPEPTLALTVPREEARTKIHEQILKGQALIALGIRSQPELDKAHADKLKWVEYTKELLGRLFTNGTPAKDFEYAGLGSGFFVVPTPWHQLIRDFQEGIRDKITRLESLIERLELIPEFHSSLTFSRDQEGSSSERFGHSRKIFVVHGRDEATREMVCRFLEKLKLQPIVLHEQASRGMTVIEKIEANSEVEFAVVLMTADDVGAIKTASDKLAPRARQNVVLELGYFVARIGRSRVCALYERGVELPSDFAGVVFVPLDGGWQLELAKEIRAAEIKVDFNLLY